MKQILRLPTADQYAYIELELGDSEVLTDDLIHESITNYNRAMGQIKGNPGITEKYFNAILEEYLTTKTIRNGQEIYEKLSPNQRNTIQDIKRTYQRLKK